MLSPSVEALMIGNCCKAIKAARTKNGMNVSRTPLRCSKLDLFLARSRTMLVKSTSYMQWTCALVRRDSTMRCAIILRMFVMGTRSPGMEAGVGLAAGAEAAGLDGTGVEVAG